MATGREYMDEIEYTILSQAKWRPGIPLVEIDVSRFDPKDVDIALQNLIKERCIIKNADNTITLTWRAVSALDREELRRNRA